MRDVMVDLETTGLQPDRTAIIQLAAVRFDIDNLEVDHNFFDAALRIPGWRFWDEGTREWWARQKSGLLQDIYSRMEPPGEVMQRFADWVGYEGQVRFWSKPLSFDFPFVSSYFRDFGVHNPFDFRIAKDCRSYAEALSFPGPTISEKDIPFTGDAHNALYDALHQIRWMFEVQRAHTAAA